MNKPTNPKDLLGLRKAPIRLFPPVALIEGSAVMGLGARKYGPYNWRENAVRHTVYLEAAMRHILQAMDGEDVDPESGRPHEAHALACMAILLDARHGGNLIDDRNKSGMVTTVLGSVQESQPPAAAPQVVSEITESGEVRRVPILYRRCSDGPKDEKSIPNPDWVTPASGGGAPAGVGVAEDGGTVPVYLKTCQHCRGMFSPSNPYADICSDCFLFGLTKNR